MTRFVCGEWIKSHNLHCAGLRRSGRSCRIQWMNYVCLNIKHGKITIIEEKTILQLHQRWGNNRGFLGHQSDILPGDLWVEIGWSKIAHPLHYLKLAHLLCFSTTFDAALWVTFIGGIIMFKNLSRNQFGNLQSKMFPVYFTMVGICLAVSAGSFGYLHPWSSSSVADKYQLDFLLSAFAFNLTNLFVFTPMTIEVIASY
ncbi:hypothetical protein EV2_033280 [Malus domestica]